MNKKVIQSLSNYPRDMTGYGKESIHPNWPNKAKIAVQFVLNYEEGGENSILHGDDASETFLIRNYWGKSLPRRQAYEHGVSL